MDFRLRVVTRRTPCVYCELGLIPVLIVTAEHRTFSSQRLGLCNPLSTCIWAVITTEQVPTGPASNHTMYCTLSVSSAVIQSM